MSTGKTNETSTQFAAKKLLGKAHTSNLKTDVNETIPSNVSLPSTTVFGDPIPNDPGDAFYTLYSASAGENATVERVYFDIVSLSDTIYDADTAPGGGGDENSESGPHGYYLKLPSNYETTSSNPNRGTGSFTNGKRIYDSRGGLQLVPPLISNASPNKYFIKIYKGDPSDPANEITSGDTIDWQFDYYAGVIFIQDYFASKEPVTASAYLYVGDYLDDKINDISGSSITVKDEGSDLTTAVSSFDFVGSGVTATTSGNDVTVTIDGGGSATAQGPTGSLQFHSASGAISGSSNLTFLDNQTLFLTGTLVVSGTIEANTFEIISTTVTEIDQSGSTSFGDSNDDTHHFTGSLSVFSSSTDLFAVDVENKSTKIKTGLTLNRTAVTSNYSVLSTDYYVGIDTATPSAQITASLPDASTLNDGQVFVFKDEGGAAGTHHIVISASSGQTIDNRNQVVLESPYSSLSLYCNGTDKFFIV